METSIVKGGVLMGIRDKRHRMGRFFHTVTHKVAGTLILLGMCTAMVQAAPAVVDVHTAGNNLIVVVLQTDITYEPDGGTSPDNLDTTLADWKVDGTSPAEIERYSIPWDELPVQWNGSTPSYPIITRHRIYLRLSGTLAEGHNYSITTPYGSTNLNFSSLSTYCESIKVNQVGYSKLSTASFANFGVYMGTGGSWYYSQIPYQVIRESDQAVMASGTGAYMGNDTAIGVPNSGEHVYRLSLTNVPAGGPYYVSVTGAGRSRSFGIGDTYSAEIANTAMRGLYLHRCGIALTEPYTAFTHAICHTNIYDTRSTSTDDDNNFNPASFASMFIQGGYHDAGDMDQSAAHTLIPILLLSFYEAFTNHFVDGQYNIPESGNGIPDFLDEAMWGVKVFEYLQVTNTSDPDYGGVRSGFDPNGYTTYGANDAANDTLNYGTLAVTEDCTALCAGIFAQASRLIRPYDSAHADALLNRAQLAWNYLGNHGINVNQAKTHFLYGALQLYLATGNQTYHNVFTNVASAVILNTGGAVWPETYWPGNGESTCQTAHFISYLLPNGRSTDPTMVQNLKAKILSFADNGTYMGPSPANQPYAQGVTAFLEWGSGTAQGRYADVWMYATLFATNDIAKQAYINAVSQYADYPLGVNPQGMSYYTGMGTDQPNDPLDCNSYYTKYGTNDGVALPDGTLDNHRDNAGNPIGNVPGICIYGPYWDPSGWGYALAVSQKMWPCWTNLPGLLRYANGHTLVEANEFTVQETMAWNAPMYAFLASTNGAVSTPPPATVAQPAAGPITIDGNLSEPGWIITNTVTKLILGTNNNTVTFGAQWDSNYLYIGAKVLDSTLVANGTYPWQGDAIEVYIDGNHNRGTSYDSYDRQFVKGWNVAGTWANGNQTNGVISAWAPITGGYSVEMAIPWTNFGITPAGQTVIGLDIANDDNDNGGANRDGQLMWAGNNNDWTDTSAFGDLTLQPAPSPDEFTSDTNTIALYHFDGNYNDASGNGFNLTPYGNVSLSSTNLGWMQSPSGQVAHFNDLGDELAITNVPDSAVEPGSSQTPLTIEARIYVRGYKAYNRANASLVCLYQDWDSQIQLYDPIYPASGEPIGPFVAGATTNEIVTASQWQNAVSLNAWHKLKITFAADGTASCYIDDNLVNTIVTSILAYRTTPWMIVLGNFDGDVDEVRISNVVR